MYVSVVITDQRERCNLDIIAERFLPDGQRRTDRWNKWRNSENAWGDMFSYMRVRSLDSTGSASHMLSHMRVRSMDSVGAVRLRPSLQSSASNLSDDGDGDVYAPNRFAAPSTAFRNPLFRDSTLDSAVVEEAT